MKKLNLRTKIILLGLLILFLAISGVCTVTVMEFREIGTEETVLYRQQLMETAQKGIQSQVDLVYALIENNYTGPDDTEKIVSLIKNLRYDNGVGYFWINDTTRPYPKMIMHPTVPALDGKVLDDPKYNCALGKKQNLFQAFIDVTAKDGAGFVDYLWPKPTKSGLTADQPKLSYVRLYKPLGWIIGTGVYIDDIDEKVAVKIADEAEELHGLILKFLFITLIGALLGTLALYRLANGVIKPVTFIIGDLSEAVDQINMAVAQINATSHGLAEGSSSQAASLEETSASISEMASMSGQNATNASEADRMMRETNAVVAQASTSMAKLNTSMQEISSASAETQKIVKTIDEIAFQTNLLALNAAVEAARAGEAGAGFAVVADEVRNLAMRAAEAAKHTASLIDATVSKVKDGAILASDTQENFSQVSDYNQKAGQLISDITIASEQQAEGVSQINRALADMESVTLELAAKSEESAASAEALNGMTALMTGTIESLGALTGVTDWDQNIQTSEPAASGPSSSSAPRLPMAISSSGSPCWEVKNCPGDRRDSCPAFPNQGSKCWMVTGTQCGGQTQGSYREKMANCKKCDVYLLHNSADGGASRSSAHKTAAAPRATPASAGNLQPCWDVKDCPQDRRAQCPAFLNDQGNRCWMVTGTQCGGKQQGSYREKMANCKKCNVYEMHNAPGHSTAPRVALASPAPATGLQPCWDVKNCPEDRRAQCPAFLNDQGNRCWMVTGTQCGGKQQGSYREKMANCKKCNVYEMHAT